MDTHFDAERVLLVLLTTARCFPLLFVEELLLPVPPADGPDSDAAATSLLLPTP